MMNFSLEEHGLSNQIPIVSLTSNNREKYWAYIVHIDQSLISKVLCSSLHWSVPWSAMSAMRRIDDDDEEESNGVCDWKANPPV